MKDERPGHKPWPWLRTISNQKWCGSSPDWIECSLHYIIICRLKYNWIFCCPYLSLQLNLKLAYNYKYCFISRFLWTWNISWLKWLSRIVHDSMLTVNWCLLALDSLKRGDFHEYIYQSFSIKEIEFLHLHKFAGHFFRSNWGVLLLGSVGTCSY